MSIPSGEMIDRIETWRMFVAVAESLSFAKAARQLGRSPQAVTRAVAALEDRLATRLLNRTTRSVMLTEAGARQLALCRHLLAEFEALEAGATGDEAHPRGALSVTATGVRAPPRPAERDRVSAALPRCRRSPSSARAGGVAHGRRARPRRAHRPSPGLQPARDARRPCPSGALRQ